MLTLPEKMDPASPRLEVHINPSIASVMIDALPLPHRISLRLHRADDKSLPSRGGHTAYLLSNWASPWRTLKRISRPGAVLSTIRFYSVSNAIRSSTNGSCRTLSRTGLNRLADMQRADGGWGWWKSDDSNPYMTAYAVYGLSEAVAADIAFDRKMLDRGVDFLAKRVVEDGPVGGQWWSRDDNVRTWMLYALSCADPSIILKSEIHDHLRKVYENRDDLTDYGRAMLAITLYRAGEREEAGIVIENFDNSVRLDKETNTAELGLGYRLLALVRQWSGGDGNGASGHARGSAQPSQHSPGSQLAR